MPKGKVTRGRETRESENLRLDGIGTVADVASDIDGVVTTDCKHRFKLTSDQSRLEKASLLVPGAEARGLVAPRITRPVLTASFPSQTMATTGPEAM